jgi:pimeloyl-ACP methyl ester carboxylesterase
MIARFVPFVPAGLVVRDRFDNLAKAPSVSIPTLVVHGAKDTLVPVEMGHAVGAAIPGARTVVLEGHGHNDMWARRAAEGPSLIDLVVTASAEARAAAGGATHGRRHAGAENGAG